LKLLCNAIPKSGTYLLSAIAGYCGFKDDNLRFVEGGVNVVDDNNNLVRFDADTSPNVLAGLADGCYAPCHLAHSDDLAAFLKANDFRHLFLYRHPADCIYSYVRFAAYSDSFGNQSDYNRKLQNHLLDDFVSDADRFNYVFQHFASGFNFETSIEWLNSDSCYAMKFEDLYDELLMLERGQIGRIIPDMFRYLGASVSQDPHTVFASIYGVGPTFMSGKSKVGQYKRLDMTKISPTINDPAFVRALKLYNYNI
jgi:hypothetical protein